MYQKVIIYFGITIILLITLGITSIVKMIELAELSQKLYDHPYTVTNATKNIEINLVSMQRCMQDILLSHNQEELDFAIEEINKKEIRVYKEFKVVFDRYLGDKNDIKNSYQAFIKWKPIRDRIIQLIKIHKIDEAIELTKNINSKYIINLNLQVDKLINYAQGKAIFFNKNAKKTQSLSIALIIIILTIIVIITILLLISLIKQLSKKDKEIVKHFKLIDQNIMSASLDKNFNVYKVSTAFSKYLGFTKQEFILNSEKLLQRTEDNNSIIKFIECGDDWISEVKVLDKSNNIRWLNSVIYPILNEDYQITSYENIFHDISDKKKIEEISNLDGLTNIYNRRYFDKVFSKEIESAKKSNKLLVFGMIDIDYFKLYNDTYGHQEGDTALKSVALLLQKLMIDVYGYGFRLGGEEFGVLFQPNSSDMALNISNQIRESVEMLKIPHRDNNISNYLTISMGVYIIKPNKNLSADKIYRLTDELLYIAKESGRNRVYMQ
jgi:diguanylate cyclase (GGDEF)-like protein/PAS domain S-box-containing protein